ncbi:MAG: hypothetical protein GWM98_06475 [Nitrospinaceae bacterium]|nr:hypothetical protein [Nitrospinaceae bacterium]NIR54201.1 hypothetical protein [Nitrospinaceae bacterium]NIS84616.1 hypothetical protein [Nitrospinaceae bacterium]NIT81411.1 hypothetical protein [Nitrospinaceae bacterium]NIU43695.1 hypothetical protein [Nitrospinaceae bacterium]
MIHLIWRSGAAIVMMAGMVLAAGWTPPPAEAAEPPPPPCHMYRGDVSLKALQAQENRMKKRLNGSDASSGDPCELAHVYYKLARLVPAQQDRFLSECIVQTQAALAQNTRAGTAYFLQGLCLGRQGEVLGIWKSLTIIKSFRRNMEMAVKISPGLDRGGPHRALGRLYFKLPGLLGGDVKKSIHHLRKAVGYGPDYWENHFFLAESYYEDDQYLKAKSELEKTLEICKNLKNDPDVKASRVDFQKLRKSIDQKIH